ncbi:MAG: N-formylglutamate amidohydrolase [Rhodospirillales bacterium]
MDSALRNANPIALGETSPDEGMAPPCQVMAPKTQTVPVVFASPHSGRNYPRDFQAASRLDPLNLRRSEDAFVDRIFASAPDRGAPLLRALFPRAYVDPNREPLELDPSMFDDPLPHGANGVSPRVAAGLGTIARVVTSGEEIYGSKLALEDAMARIGELYHPYHRTLSGLIEATREKFGGCLLIDCHSMPSVGGPMDSDTGSERADMVLGDCHQRSCAPEITRLAEQTLTSQGFVVNRNTPYAGGYTTLHYGAPAKGVHALQIEINRALYMDEDRIIPGPGFDGLKGKIDSLVEAITGIDPKILAQP